MQQFYTRLEDYIRNKGYTFNSLENELNIGQSVFSQARSKNRKLSAKNIKLLQDKFPDLDINYLYGKEISPYKKLNQNVVEEEGPVYNPRKPQENYQMQSIDHEFLMAITKQLEVKDDQIRTLTKIIENITTK